MALPQRTLVSTAAEHLADHNILNAAFTTAFSPLAYEAEGDGTTDDTTAVQTAMTAATNKTLYIPKGMTFLIGKVNVPAGVTITGGGTLKAKVFTGSEKLFELQGDDITFDGVTIDLNGPAQSVIVNGISAPSGSADADGLTVRNCVIKNGNNQAISSTIARTDWRIEGNVFRDFTTSGSTFVVSCTNGMTRFTFDRNEMRGITGSGVQLYGTTPVNYDIHITNNKFFEVDDLNIETQQGSRSTVSGNLIQGPCTFGISTGSVSRQTIANNVIIDSTGYGLELGTGSYHTVTGNVFRNCDQGIGIWSPSGGSHVAITGNIFDTTTDSAIEVRGPKYVTISGNIFMDPFRAVLVGEDSNNTAAENVTISDNTVVFRAARSGITPFFVQASFSERVSIRDNDIDVGVEGTTSYQGIVHISDTVTDLTIEGNIFRGTTEGVTQHSGVYIAASSTVDGLRVVRNRFDRFLKGVDTASASVVGTDVRVVENEATDCTTAYDLNDGENV